MKLLIQKVSSASVSIDCEAVSSIGEGLLLFLGVFENDEEKDVSTLVHKLFSLRMFPDHQGKMNHPIDKEHHELLLVSQFTLCARFDKGQRPDFSSAAKPERAHQLYTLFIEEVKKRGVVPKCGRFRQMMDVSLTNSGPVTFLLDSNEKSSDSCKQKPL